MEARYPDRKCYRRLRAAPHPDPQPDQDKAGTSGAEGVTADAAGKVYGAEVGPKALEK